MGAIMQISLHNIVSIEMSNARHNTVCTDSHFYTRKVTLIMEDGEEFKITLFGKAHEPLTPLNERVILAIEGEEDEG